MQRKKLSSRTGITIKPDMSLEDRKVESLLLKHRRFLINEGVERSAIKIRGNSIFVNRNKICMVVDPTFQECQPVNEQKQATHSSISQLPKAGDTQRASADQAQVTLSQYSQSPETGKTGRVSSSPVSDNSS